MDNLFSMLLLQTFVGPITNSHALYDSIWVTNTTRIVKYNAQVEFGIFLGTTLVKSHMFHGKYYTMLRFPHY